MRAGLLAVFLLSAVPASAQITLLHTPRVAIQGDGANLFFEWAGDEPAHGIIVDLPGSWSLDSVTVVRPGYRPVPARIRNADGTRYRVEADEPLSGPHDLILHVRPGDVVMEERVEVTPFVRRGAVDVQRAGLRTERRLRVVRPPAEVSNRALSFAADEAEPLVFRRGRTPDLSLNRPFTVSFWLRSAALGEVVLSTWNGDERRAYPLEVVVDAAGRLRAFHGRPGEHRSLGSAVPVADGSWHLVALTNHPREGWMRLSVDGQTVDSLYAAPPPRIDMQVPLILGGRAESESPYFDGMKRFSGRVDEFRVISPGREPIDLGFQGRIPEDLLENPAPDLRREAADLGMHEELDSFRAVPGPDGVTLTWSAAGPQARMYVVERSFDGRSFEEVERVSRGRDVAYRFHDPRVEDRVVFYRIRQVFPDGSDRISGTLRVGLGAGDAADMRLLGNFPNPFNAATTIKYELVEPAHVHLAVWDLSGQPIATLVDQRRSPGVHEARFEADELPSGTYFVHLRTPEGTRSRKIILMK